MYRSGQAGVLTGCGRPPEWELAGTGVRVDVSGRTAQRVFSPLASAARQQAGRARLISNKSAELSWHWLAGLGGRLSGYF